MTKKWNSPHGNMASFQITWVDKVKLALKWLRISSNPKTWQRQMQLFSEESSVQLLSRVQLFATPWTAACQASLSITNSRSLPKYMSIASVMPSNHVLLCHPLVLLPSIFPSIRVFSNESVLCISGQSMGVSASASVLPMNSQDWFPLGLTGLISLRMDWFDFLAVQGTLKSLLQHHNSKASILWHSTFFMVQLSHPYMTTGKTIALIR